jgi:hypothetical protein
MYVVVAETGPFWMVLATFDCSLETTCFPVFEWSWYARCNELWSPEARGVLSRMYVRQTRVFWHEEIAEPIG